MTKKGSLTAALHQFDNRQQAPAPEPVETRPAEPEPVAWKAVPPSRRGKKALTGYFDPSALKQLRVLAASEDMTMQALMTEAINDLFKKYGKPHIA